MAVALKVEKTNRADIVQFPEKPIETKLNNKKKGRKSEVYAFEIDDMRKVTKYFADHNMWLHNMAFVFGCNMARRIGDTLSLTWEHIYNPETGRMRQDIMEIVEDKTDKLANPRINEAVKEAIETYIEKTGVDVAKNGYREPVFMQLSGTHAGKVMSADGYRKALKKVAKECGIEYNVGTHSTRKTFGKMSRMLHPNDYDSMETLQTIFNHSDTKTTKNYIGLTKEKVDQYYDDMGNFYAEYVTGDKDFHAESAKTVVNVDINDLRDLIAMAYTEGQKNAGAADAKTHIDSINAILSILDDLVK